MAYLDLAYAQGSAPPVTSRRLNALDRHALAASRRDGLRSLAAPHGAWRLLAPLLGLRGGNPLADPALEALRRYAVLLRHGGDALASPAASAAVAAGYSVDQIAHARWLVAREEPPASAGTVPATLLAGALTIALAFGLAMAHAADDVAIGIVLSLFAVVTLAPWAVRPRPAGVRPA